MYEKDLIIQRLLYEIAQLKKIIEAQAMRIAELEKRLGLNSNNSSKPPSSDGFNKPPRTGNSRSKGKKPNGGQKGHAGYTLLQKDNPDKIIRHELATCPHCQNSFSSGVIGIVRRQVFDIPPITMQVTEHQAEIKVCPCCNMKVQAAFPNGVDAPVQYGERIKATAIYFSGQHYIPEDRLQMIFQDLYGINIATASLVKFSDDLAVKLTALNEKWAKKMKRLLLFMCKYRNFFVGTIPKDKLNRLEKIYDKILVEGLAYHSIWREHLARADIYTKKRYPGHNLLLRLSKYRCDVLRFLYDENVPFTNNQAERDIRMMKLKQKISGGFRTLQGAETFISIRSFLSTARKQNWNVFAVLSQAVINNIPGIN